MPQDVKPSDLLQTVPSANGAFCGRFSDLLKFPALFAALYTYERNEQGDITAEFCADITACIESDVTDGGDGSGPGTGTLPTPTVTATDGAFTDKVVVSWGAITGATRYEVWRGLTSVVSAAVKVADVNSATTYNDTSADPGTSYWYFVRAFNDTPAQSSFSVGDSGYAGTLVASLDAVTDLVASKGISSSGYGASVSLVFTKVASAQSYDIYRNTVDDYTTATRIDRDRVPYVFNDAYPLTYGSSPQFVDNGTDLVYHDSLAGSPSDPKAYQNFYYWVVAKRSNPSAFSVFSNSNAGALGWAVGQGQGITPLYNLPYLLTSGGSDQVVPAAATMAWLGVFGSKAGGAGGDAARGGGGGGAGGMVTGFFTVSATGKFRVVSSPEADPTAPASATNGNDGPATTLQYSDDGTFGDTVDLVVCAAPTAGQYSAGGSGAGGSGATATVDPSVNPSNIYAGRNGFAAAASVKGGDSGYLFGFFRGTTNNDHAATFAGSADAVTTHAGGGSSATPQGAGLAVGTKGLRGAAFLLFY